ncbi:hypothetical protein PVAP13_2NG470800 [Panicum virgatum]|uniref:Probable purine permease n=1 Tax=Panicum virgatum TaxID=38727 RepID=A0A8T0VPF1_PANVG|nr:hypothetical protein PVAP13_2NG470800 [Panicum virgatum]
MDEEDGGHRHHTIRVASSSPDVAMEEGNTKPDHPPSLKQKAAEVIAASLETYRSRPFSFWLLLCLSSGAMLTAFPASSLLSRLYYSDGGQSKWILSWAAVAGWPLPALLLLPLYLLGKASPTPLSPALCSWYALLGFLSAADNLMYAWAYAYLPASTASLVVASSLAFSALFGRAIAKNRLSLSSLNAVVVITAGVMIVALDSGSDRPPGVTARQYALGFALDVLGSALHGLIFALLELIFARVLGRRSFHVVLEQQAAVSLCARRRRGLPGDAPRGGAVRARRRGCVRERDGVDGRHVPAGRARRHRRAVPGVHRPRRRAERRQGAPDERRRGDLVSRPDERVQDPGSGDHCVGVRVLHGRALLCQENVNKLIA